MGRDRTGGGLFFSRISFREIIFYEKDKVVEEIEGWPGENRWRYDEIRKII